MDIKALHKRYTNVTHVFRKNCTKITLAFHTTATRRLTDHHAIKHLPLTKVQGSKINGGLALCRRSCREREDEILFQLRIRRLVAPDARDCRLDSVVPVAETVHEVVRAAQGVSWDMRTRQWRDYGR